MLIISFLHLIGLFIFAIDYYYLRWFSDIYHEGRVGDQQYFVIRAEAVFSGKYPYEGLKPNHSLAPPLSMYIMGIPFLLDRFIPLHIDFLYRIYFSLFNIASAWLLIKISELKFPKNATPKIGILFGFSPYMIISGVFLGSDECLGAFLMILIVYLVIQNKPISVLFTIGVGTSVKYYPLLLIPYFLSTRTTKTDQFKYGILSGLSVLLFFLPFYFFEPINFMNQFDSRVIELPWDEPGNVGIVMLIVKSGIINLDVHLTAYRIFWMSSVVIMSLIQIFKGYNRIEHAALVPSVFFIVYPQFFFNYFAIVIPFYFIAMVRRGNEIKHWLFLEIGLLFASLTTSPGIGYDTIYHQKTGKLPLLQVLSVLLFYIIWIYLLSLILRRNQDKDVIEKLVPPQL